MANDFAKGSSELLVLQILAGTKLHGYGIIKTIKQRSGGILDFTGGSIYPLLHQLERDGLLKSEWQLQPSGRRRKIYSITETGKKRLLDNTKEWNQLCCGIGRILDYGKENP